MNEKKFSKESGQSLVLVAAAMVILVLFVAITVDVSNAYYNRRTAQNAADGAALGGVSQMALEINNRKKKVDLDIKAAMNAFAESNGIADTDGTPGNWLNNNVHGWYMDTSGNRVQVDGKDAVVGEMYLQRIPDDAYGIEAIVDITATTFFGGIFGLDGLPLHARAVSLVKEACGEDCVVPIVTQMDPFFDADGELLVDQCFNIYSESDDGQPGSYGWVAWTWQETACLDGSRPCPVDQGNLPCDTPTLAANLHPDNCASGYVQVEDWIANSTGIATADKSVLCFLDYYLGLSRGEEDCGVTSDVPLPFTIPVYDYTNVSEANKNPSACGGTVDPGELDLPDNWGLHYHVAGFAKMQILGYMLSQGAGVTAQIDDPELLGLPADFDPLRDCVTLGQEPHDGNRITGLLLDFVTEFNPEESCFDPTGTLLSAPKLTE